MWSKLASTVALLSAQAGFSRIRLVNLTQVNVFDEVRGLARRGAPMTVRSDTLSAKGSTSTRSATCRWTNSPGWPSM